MSPSGSIVFARTPRSASNDLRECTGTRGRAFAEEARDTGARDRDR